MQLSFLDLVETTTTSQVPPRTNSFTLIKEVPTQKTNGVAKRVNGTSPKKKIIINPGFAITDDHLGIGGQKTKYKANVAAIKLIKQLEQENRPASQKEKETLVQYVGWGGIKQAFEDTDKWRDEYQELKQLLTPAEYDSARATTLNAHYTSLPVIRGIWRMIEHFGFEGGDVLEPAMGIGHFFGCMPQKLRQNSQLYGVDIDSISARIGKLLYPEARIINSPFERVAYLRKDQFSLIVSNFPFGKYGIYDPEFFRGDKAILARYSIHDYFFAKSLELLAPGGMLAAITSRYTMDKRDKTIREYIDSQATLVGALRLPVNAFKANAGTEVTTDILFLRKRDDSTILTSARFLDVQQNKDTGIWYNEIYHLCPDMMAGEMQVTGGRHPDASECVGSTDALQDWIYDIGSVRMFDKMIDPRPSKPAMVEGLILPDPDPKPWHRNGSYAVSQGHVMRLDKGRWTPTKISTGGKVSYRVEKLIGLRDAFRDLLEANVNAESDLILRLKQEKLTQLYQSAVRSIGYINERSNIAAFKDDPDAPALRAIEKWFPRKGKGEMTPIFTERVIRYESEVTKVESASAALAVSLREFTKINWTRMTELTGKDQDELIEELGEAIYLDPAENEWQVADEYLSGNIRTKLAQAREAGIQRNIDALEEVMPADLQADEIYVQFGAAWINEEYINEFVNDHIFRRLPSYYGKLKIKYSNAMGKWYVDRKSSGMVQNSPENTKQWGTKRRPLTMTMEQTLNGIDVTVRDEIEGPDGKIIRKINQVETIAAREKQAKLKDEFAKWIWTDEARTAYLVTKYNALYNSTVERKYDGSHLVFPGMNPAVTLRTNQIDAIWRTLVSNSVLYGHKVGFGKTFALVASAMMLRQLGIRRKPVIVVKNATFSSFVADAYHLYPAASILAIDSMSESERKRNMARITFEDWDMIIVTHENFEKISLSNETQETFIYDMISEITTEIAEVKSRNNSYDKNRITKYLEAKKKQLETKLKKLRDKGHTKDDSITFEQSGIDALFIDEAQVYKNLYFFTSMNNVSGIGGSESGRAFDAYLKIRWMQQNRDCTTVFSTGTPIENSLSEMYTMMRFMMYDHLEQIGLHHFDAWAKLFGETVTAIEMKPDGSGFQSKTRFAKFNNVPELLRMFWSFADICMESDEIERPELEGGKPHGFSAAPTEELKEIVETLSNRASNMPDDPSEDNMLVIVNEANKAALDPRLVSGLIKVDENGNKCLAEDGGYEKHIITTDNPGSKVNLCVQNILKIHDDTAENNLAQVVFLDLSAPGGAATLNKHGRIITVYDDIKEKLVAGGIDAAKIAFIHDAKKPAQRRDLFQRVNAGEVRVLLASTQKGGIGVNIQKKLVALHHVDCPWKPSEIEQREGRILRQGNSNKTVFIFRYVTEQSFDVYRWDTVERKAKFISQVMNGRIDVRSIEDIDAVVIGFAEMKALATGNPAILDLVKTETELTKLKAIRSSSRTENMYAQNKIQKNLATIHAVKQDVIHFEKLLKQVEEEGPEPIQELGKTLYEKATAHYEQGHVGPLTTLYGIPLMLKSHVVQEGATKNMEQIRDFWAQQDGEEMPEQKQQETVKLVIVIDLGDQPRNFFVRVSEKDRIETNTKQLLGIFGTGALQKEIEAKTGLIKRLEAEAEALRSSVNGDDSTEAKIAELESKLEQLRIEVGQIKAQETVQDVGQD